MSIDDLEKVLARQQELQSKGKHVFIAELMVQMGIIKEKDMRSVMLIKEEAGKKFVLTDENIPKVISEEQDLDILAENQKLKEECEILKVKLSRILTFIKENKV